MQASDILGVIEHRPWQMPPGRWLMMQSWHDLLFAHWPVPAKILRPLVPSSLELDTYSGDAWVSIAPFHMRMQSRGLPIVHSFPEMNCRTYVTLAGKPGILFFSLDAGSRLAVWGARTFYLLPYFNAQMTANKAAQGFQYFSRRNSNGATFDATYEPKGPVCLSAPGTLEHWLTERYCLYAYAHGRTFRGEIHHAPWPLQDATCDIAENSIASAAGIQLPAIPPLLHFARRIDVVIWPLRRVSDAV